MEQIDEQTTKIERGEPIDYEQLKDEMPATIVLELINPKALKSGHTEALHFQEPTGAHIEKMNKAGTERAQHTVGVSVVSECCGIGADEYNLLGTRDIARLNEVLNYFLGADSPRPVQGKQ